MNPQYKQLTLNFTNARKKVPTHTGFKYWVKKFVITNRYTQNILRRAASTLQGLEQIGNVRLRSYQALAEDSRNATEFASQYGYSDEMHELSTVLSYRHQLEEGTENSKVESGMLYKSAEQVITRLLNDDSSIRHFVNFGVGYAHIDSVLA